MRILHAPTNVANQAWAMAQGLRALGHEAEVWHYPPNPFDFPADRIIDVDQDPTRVLGAMFDAVDGDFDVLHFHLGRSLLRPVGGLPLLWDLPVWRALGKRLIFTFHGVDVRYRELEKDRWSALRFGDDRDRSEEIAKRLAIIRTYAHSLTVLSALNLPFVPDAIYIPKAIDLSAYPAALPSGRSRPLVVHAPSSRGRKGTEYVVRGVEELQRKGLEFEFRLLESLPHTEMRRAYGDADVVVDNLVFGDYEVSTLEAMALGRPVVTRVRAEVRAAHPDLPAVSADPDAFVDAMTPLLQDANLRARLGAKGRAYVERTHAAELIAAKLVPLYETPPRPVWQVFPDWTGVASDRKLERYEQRLQELEVKAGELRRRLRERDSLVHDLRALYSGSRPLKILRELRRRRKG